MFRTIEGLMGFISVKDMKSDFSTIRVTMKAGLPKIDVGSISLGETKEGDSVELPLWAAHVLSTMGFAEVLGENFDQEIFRTLNREKMQGATHLSTIRPDFYPSFKRRVREVSQNIIPDQQRREALIKLQASGDDLFKLRIKKLLQYAASRISDSLPAENISPEEKSLIRFVGDAVAEFRNVVMGIGEQT